ncbi:MAG: GGDEF domain-containing protein [Proteobacteria bacterium]|nr:GGDEF domain-containing protein [Pseudomonadota bacterium]
MLRIFFIIFMPLAVLGGCWAAFGQLELLPPRAMAVVPYGAAVFAAIVCWRFKRSRAVPVLVLTALACWFAGLLAQGLGQEPLSRVVYAAFAVLLPLNVLLASLLGDRGVFSRSGLGQLAFYGVQILLVLFVASGAFGASGPQAALGLLDSADQLLHWRLLGPAWDQWTLLPQPALLGGTLGVALLLLKAAVKDSPMDAGLAVGLAGILATLHSVGHAPQPAALAMGTALALAMPLLQDSYRMAFLDELTGLPARRSLVADLKGLGSRYAIAMADIDHFKKFNDSYGHDVGDEVLRMVASHLGRVTGGGRAYRYGGEEFTILFPRKSADEAFEPLDALRASIEGAGFSVRTVPRPVKKPRTGAKSGTQPAKKQPGTKTVSVTISMGLAERVGGQSPEEVLKQADKALYKAKKKGRNRVERV